MIDPNISAPKILIVDDDPKIRSILRRFLGGKGFRVETADDGETALAALAKGPVHLLLLDVRMPRMDGLEMLRRLRNEGKNIPVVVITGELDMAAARECMRLGACDHIVKPLNFDYLEVVAWAKIRAATHTAAGKACSVRIL